MRRGWKAGWDSVERFVWTGWAFIWAFALIAVVILIAASRILQSDPARGMGSALLYSGVPILAIAHAFTYAGLWLRRQFFAPPSGKDRDR